MMRPSGFRIGHFFGIPVFLHASLLLFAAVMVPLIGHGPIAAVFPGMGAGVYVVALLLIVMLYASVLAHEYGHALVARDGFGLRVHSITLFLFGGVTALADDPRRPAAEFWITLAGPVVNLALGAAFLALGYARSPQLWETFYYGIEPQGASPAALILWLTGALNLSLAVLNLIPSFPLDGGRLFRSFVWALTGRQISATRWTAGLSNVIAFALAGYGIGTMFEGAGFYGLWFVVMAIFLVGATRQALLTVIVREGLRDVTASELMVAPRVSLPSNLSLDAAAEQFLASNQRVLPVVDFNDDFVGLVSVMDLSSVPRRSWAMTTLRALLLERPALLRARMASLVVRPNTPGLEIYMRIAAHPFGSLPVLEGGRLVGIIPQQRVRELLDDRARE